MSAFANAVINVVFNKEDALKGLQQLKDSTKNSASEMKKAFLGAFAGIGSTYLGFKAFKQVYDDSLKIADLADKWGKPVDGISQFTNKMALLGGTTEDAMNTVNTLEQAITDLRTTGSGPLKSVSAQIGANLYNEKGEIKNYAELLEEIRQRFKNLKDDAVKSKVAQELGLTSPAQLRYLKLSDDELKRINREAKEYGYINSKNAKQLKDFRESISKLKMAFTSLAGGIMSDFKPVIDTIAGGMKLLAEAPEWLRKTIVTLAGLKIIDSFTGLSNAFGKLNTVAKTLHTNLLGIAGVLGAIYTAYQAFNIFSEDNDPEKIKERGGKYGAEWDYEHGIDWDKEGYIKGALKWIRKGAYGLATSHLEKTAEKNKNASYSMDIVSQSMTPESFVDFNSVQKPVKSSAPITNTKSVHIDKIEIKSIDPMAVSQELQNMLNRQFADGVI